MRPRRTATASATALPSPSPTRDLVRLAGLVVRRGRTDILRGIDWRMRRGEHWVVLGPNGCGKTSLLRVLLGYLTPSAGEVHLLGADYGRTDWRELRRQLGLVSTSLHGSIPPGEVALDTVVSGHFAQLDLWAKADDTLRRRARRLLATVGATALVDRPWAFLSQGERQRVLIARALMARPKVLLLDEPCTGLDPVARAHFLAAVESLAQSRGAPGLVLVTHHVEEITPAFSHALLLRGGSCVAAGPHEQVLTSANLSQVFGAPVRLKHAKAKRAARRGAPGGSALGLWSMTVLDHAAPHRVV